MDGNFSQGGLVQGGTSFDGFDFPEPMWVHCLANNPNTTNQHESHPCGVSSVHSSINEVFPITLGTLQNCDQTMSIARCSKGDISRNSLSDEDEPSFYEGDGEGRDESARGKTGSPWQRVKWTEKMVRLMITAVSYVGGEDTTYDDGSGRRKFAVIQIKCKWKCISKVMAERGYHVSPQQCEDKFNDLNKRYKKLNDMLGRGISCQVVENPALLDMIDYLTEKEKDDVRKTLSSKHLFYEEMCSYNNKNRLHLPHDPALQRSLQAALRDRDDHNNHDIRRSNHDEDMETEDQHFKENYASHGDSRGMHNPLEGAMNKLRQGKGEDNATTYVSSLNCPEHNKNLHPRGQMTVQSDMNQGLHESTRAAWLQQKGWIESNAVQLEEQKLQIQVDMLELEKQRYKWQKFSQKKDRELEKLRMENARMKLENELIALELKRKEMEANLN